MEVEKTRKSERGGRMEIFIIFLLANILGITLANVIYRIYEKNNVHKN